MQTDVKLQEKVLANWLKENQRKNEIPSSNNQNVPDKIEISGYCSDRKLAKLFGDYDFYEIRNNRPCYRFSKTTDFHRPCLWFEIGHWVIGPIFDHHAKPSEGKTFIRLRKLTNQENNFAFQASWEQFSLPLNTRLAWKNKISIQIKSVATKNVGVSNIQGEKLNR